VPRGACGESRADFAGRSLEAAGNGRPREMIASGLSGPRMYMRGFCGLETEFGLRAAADANEPAAIPVKGSPPAIFLATDKAPMHTE
jgi:hypothetical protein